MSTPTRNSVQSEIVALSGEPVLDSLLYSTRWVGANGASLTYSFPNSTTAWRTPYSELNEPSGLQPFGSAETGAARAALDTWSHYANLTFTETGDSASNVGDIRFAYTSVDNDDSAAHAYYPGSSPASGDVWLDSGELGSDFQPGSAGFFVLLHELGHTLGLKHPFGASSGSASILDPALDSIAYTIMSYDVDPDFRGPDYGISILPTTPMILDIAAMQYLYGAKSFNAGDTQYVFNEDKDYFQTIYDTGGNDTIVWNSSEQYAIIDLTSASWSSLGNALYIYNAQDQIVKVEIYNVAIYLDTVIENAISGASDDDIYGNSVANRLEAGGGHDIVWGEAGADTILGGEGNDHLYGQSPNGGADGADSISGGDGTDYLQGNAGNDTLDGGAGSDRVNGGNNDDDILGGAGNDTINGNVGSDTISGGDGNDSLRGGQGGDSISAGAGDDILSGDLGVDTLSGGAGADIFAFSGAGSASDQPDRILDFTDGTDRISIGFIPTAILTGAAQSSAAAAAATAQQLFDGHAGNNELAALAVGSDTYLFYAASGGATINSAVLVMGVDAQLFGISDFA